MNIYDYLPDWAVDWMGGETTQQKQNNKMFLFAVVAGLGVYWFATKKR
ncbi:hypothetical protein [Polycladidibacter hongkongensis]|nr:hypothetical protein [Pseudovibrio hongkongensis]